MERSRERELKYDLDPTWSGELPAALVPGGGDVRIVEKELVNTYVDTDDASLAKAGITARRRSGGGEDGWQVKIPSGKAREELRFDDSPTVPAEVEELLFGVRAGRPLHPVARIETHRVAHELRDDGGRVLAEVADDTVHAVRMGDEAVVTAWRELEIELVDGDEDFLRRADKAARKAGAVPSAVPVQDRPRARRSGAFHVHRSHDRSAGAAVPAHPVRPHRGRRPRPAPGHGRGAQDAGRDAALPQRAACVRRRFRRRRRRVTWTASWPGSRRCSAPPATRRCCAGISTSSSTPCPPRSCSAPSGPGCTASSTTPPATPGTASATPCTASGTPELMHELAEWDAQPALLAEGFGEAAGYLRAARRKAAKRLRAAATAPDRDLALHRARKAAKRARYTAEVVKPALGKTARRQQKSAEHIQEVLGGGQDAVVAAEFLRRIGASAGVTPDENGFTYGLLWQLQQQLRHDVHAAAAGLSIRH